MVIAAKVEDLFLYFRWGAQLWILRAGFAIYQGFFTVPFICPFPLIKNVSGDPKKTALFGNIADFFVYFKTQRFRLMSRWAFVITRLPQISWLCITHLSTEAVIFKNQEIPWITSSISRKTLFFDIPLAGLLILWPVLRIFDKGESFKVERGTPVPLLYFAPALNLM